jgi:hypothetical protein
MPPAMSPAMPSAVLDMGLPVVVEMVLAVPRTRIDPLLISAPTLVAGSQVAITVGSQGAMLPVRMMPFDPAPMPLMPAPVSIVRLPKMVPSRSMPMAGVDVAVALPWAEIVEPTRISP